MLADRLVKEEAESLIGYAADDLKARRLAPDVPRADLLRSLAEVQLEALNAFNERDEGKIKASEPTLPLPTEPDPEPKVMTPGTRGTGTTLSDVLTAFRKERAAGGRSLATKTMDEHKAAVRMFEEFLGCTPPVKSITKKNVIDYKQALLDKQTRYTQHFPGVTLPQAIRANARRSEPYETLGPQTIN